MAIYSGNKRLQAFTSVVQAGTQTPSGGVVDDSMNMKFKDRSGNDLFSVNLSNLSFVQTIDIHPHMGMTIDGNGVLTSDSGDDGYLVLSGFSDIAPYMMSNIFRRSDNILSLRFEDLELLHNNASLYKIGCQNKSIKLVEFPKLSSIDGSETIYQGFYQTPTQKVDMSKLVSVNGLTSMRECFAECANLTSVNLDSLESINGSYSMYNAFYNCNIQDLNLSNLTSISGSYTASGIFSTNPNLSSVNLSNLRSIKGEDAMQYSFDACSKLNEISLPNLETVTGSYALYRAFRNSGIKIANFFSLKQMSNANALAEVCSGCKNLTNVDMHSLTSFSNYGLHYAFSGCNKLSSIIMSDSISYTEACSFNYAFNQCTSLKDFQMGIVGSIGNGSSMTNMFNGCSNLSSFTLNGNFDIIATNYYGTGYEFQYMFVNCSNLKNVSMPGLKSIKNCYYVFEYAFDGCTSLTNISFDELITIEGNYSSRTFAEAFRSCAEIEVHFPKLIALTQNSNNATNAAFYNCTKLKKVYFDSLNSITGSGQNYLFNGCTILEEIHFKNDPDIQAYIEAHSGYATKWGCPNADCQIIFDL